MAEEKKNTPNSVQEFVKLTGRCKASIYNLAKKLGRLPTVEEVQAQHKGRPKKYQ